MRVTDSILKNKIKTFESLSSMTTATNQWHNHCSLHCRLADGSQGHQIAVGTSKRELFEKLDAICSYLYIKTLKEYTKDV